MNDIIGTLGSEKVIETAGNLGAIYIIVEAVLVILGLAVFVWFAKKMFDDFTLKVLNATPRFKTEVEVIKHAEDYDCIICGSDQIWNLSKSHDAPAANPIFFLNFPKKQRRVAYAASFASFVKQASMHEDEFLPWLKKFDAVSVREQDGVEYVKSKGL